MITIKTIKYDANYNRVYEALCRALLKTSLKNSLIKTREISGVMFYIDCEITEETRMALEKIIEGFIELLGTD